VDSRWFADGDATELDGESRVEAGSDAADGDGLSDGGRELCGQGAAYRVIRKDRAGPEESNDAQEEDKGDAECNFLDYRAHSSQYRPILSPPPLAFGGRRISARQAPP
jgi:hypothetical protein